MTIDRFQGPAADLLGKLSPRAPAPTTTSGVYGPPIPTSPAPIPARRARLARRIAGDGPARSRYNRRNRLNRQPQSSANSGRAGWRVAHPDTARAGQRRVRGRGGRRSDRLARDARAVPPGAQDADAICARSGPHQGALHAEFFAANATGTRLLVEAAIAARNRPRFVLLSSIAARHRRSPTTPPASWPAKPNYPARRRTAMVDPATAAVYGPGDRETLRSFRALRMGCAMLPPVRNARLSLLHFPHLPLACPACATSPVPD